MVANYTLDQAQRDIAQLRFQLIAALNSAVLGTLKVLGASSFVGTITFPDGSTWSVSGPSLAAPLALSQGGTGFNAGSVSALLTHLGGAPSASPTFSGTVTMPDGSTWSASGLSLASNSFISIDTWHTITLDSGWATQSGYAAPSYRLGLDGTLQLTGNAVRTFANATAVNLNGSNPIPSAVRPTTAKDMAYSDQIGRRAHISLSTGGVFGCTPPNGLTYSTTVFAEFNAVIALNI